MIAKVNTWMAELDPQMAWTWQSCVRLNETAIRKIALIIPVLASRTLYPTTTPMPNLWNKLAGRKPRNDPAFALPGESMLPPDFLQPGSETGEAPRRHVGPATLPETPLPNMASGANDLMVSTARPRRGWRERLSGSGFAHGLTSLFARNPVLSDELLDELEIILLSADVGVAATTELIGDLRRRMHKREFADAAAMRDALRERLVASLEPVARQLDVGGRKPFMLLVVGVNGVGKTTTIGKLARRFQNEQRDVLLAAGDTFRAAAVAQLQE